MIGSKLAFERIYCFEVRGSHNSSIVDKDMNGFCIWVYHVGRAAKQTRQ